MSDFKSEAVDAEGDDRLTVVAVAAVGVAVAGVVDVVTGDENPNNHKNLKQEQVVSLDFEKANGCQHNDGLDNAVGDALEADNSGRVVVSKGENGNCEYDFMPDPQ